MIVRPDIFVRLLQESDLPEMATYKGEGSAAKLAWKIVGGTAVALIAAAVLFGLPDIKRYIKMRRM